MKKEFKLKGNTPDEKFTNIEKMFTHMRKRVGKTVIGVIPPCFLAMHAEEPMEGGNILHYLCPVRGNLSVAAMLVDEYLGSKLVEFSCGIIGVNGKQQLQNFETKKKAIVKDLNIDVEKGDMIVLNLLSDKIKLKDSNDFVWPAKGFWITLMITVEYLGAPQKRFMLDQLDTIADKEDEDEGI